MGVLDDLQLDPYAIECVDLDPDVLEEEFVRLPADLAYWNARYSQAAREYQLAKWHREQVAAQLHPRLREQLMVAAKEAASAAQEEVDKAQDQESEEKPAKRRKTKPKVSVKSPTVDDIQAAVVTHSEYVAARELEIEAEKEKSHIYGIVDAVRCKRDMLMQIGAMRRAELQGDPQLRNEAQAYREAKKS